MEEEIILKKNGVSLVKKRLKELLKPLGFQAYVKTKLCPLVIPSECPACRQKFFKMENIPLNKRQTRT